LLAIRFILPNANVHSVLKQNPFRKVNVTNLLQLVLANPFKDDGSREWDEWNEMDIRYVSLGFF
jgi:hypothetical protein